MLNDFHFLRPEWLIALPFIALLLALVVKRTKQNSGWENVCDADLLHFQLAQNGAAQKQSFQLLHWTLPLLFFITIIALAGPTWEKKDQPVFQQGNALVIILDLSLSMNATDIKPSRLERSKLKLIDILKQKREGQTALIAFAGDAHIVSPLTIDNKTIISLLPALNSSIMPMPGSHLVDALNTAKQLFKNAGFAQGDILLLSDGFDPAQKKGLKKVIKTLSRQGYRFSIIGVGSQTGSPIPMPGQSGFVKDQAGQVVLSKLSAEPLKKLTQLGNGQYNKLSLDDSDFKDLLENSQHNNKPAVKQKDQIEQWYDAGVYLTLLLIPMALSGFRKGLFSIVPVFLLIPFFVCEPAAAAEPASEQFNGQWQQSFQNFWATPDQQAQKSFKEKDYPKAAQHFKHNDWKASSHYRNGEFEQALKYYSQSDNAHSLYNKGNTLANMGKFPQAKQAYEQALKKKPGFSAADKNKTYMEELIEQQKQQQQSQENSDPNKEQSDEKSEDQQQDQKSNSDDDSSKSNKSDSEESKEKGSDENDSEGSQSGEKDQENKASEEQEKDNEDQSDKQESSTESQQKNEPQAEDQQAKQASHADPAMMDEQEKALENAQEQEEQQKTEDDAQPSGSDNTKADVLSQLNQEERQSLKQWLQRIPDNPGQLLKVKFRNNTLIKQKQMDTEDYYKGDPW